MRSLRPHPGHVTRLFVHAPSLVPWQKAWRSAASNRSKPPIVFLGECGVKRASEGLPDELPRGFVHPTRTVDRIVQRLAGGCRGAILHWGFCRMKPLCPRDVSLFLNIVEEHTKTQV